jgi:1-pyrroline-5-carboxylate dehydrogenase
MAKGVFNIPEVKNETIKSYVPGSPERAELKKMLADLRAVEVELPMIIGGNEVTTEAST